MLVNKAVTFSFDDGVEQDRRLISILNKYGLKCTFNLNSGLFGLKGTLTHQGVTVNHFRLEEKEIKSLYVNHEVASHCLTHPNLLNLTEEEIIFEVETDRVNLSNIVGYEVVGFASPYGAQDNRVEQILKNKTGVKYARNANSNGKFDLQENLYNFTNTSWALQPFEETLRLAYEFINLKTEKNAIFYIGGHSYEMDLFENGWENIETLCKVISGKQDIFYGTNKQVLLSNIWEK
ncbi:MAG: polysaccharide deacetylase family protein [Clostridia bacterium]|nr:polysaccharide deacetylase family protein [Clostridia bacterium]